MTGPLVIASMMRAQGATGVQTHVNAVRAKFIELGRKPQLVTPFDLSPRYFYPVFGVRRLLEPAMPAVGVWWYRYWHAWFLRRALRGVLAQFGPCVLYAQCPPFGVGRVVCARLSQATRGHGRSLQCVAGR